MKNAICVCLLLSGLFLLTSGLIAQTEVNEILEIRMEGRNLENFHLDIQGNNLLINGQKPEDLGVKVSILRHKEGISSDYKNYESAPPDAGKGKAYLGAITKEVRNGIEITELNSEGPAKRSGLKRGDVIATIDGNKMTNHEDLVSYMETKNPGDTIAVKVRRDKKVLTKNIVLDNTLDKVMPARRPAGPPRPGRPRNEPSVRERPSLGLKLKDLEDGRGLEVIEIQPGSAAEAAGFRISDQVLSINGKYVRSTKDVGNALDGLPANADLTFKVWRDGRELKLEAAR